MVDSYCKSSTKMEEIRKYFESEHILFQKKFRRMINSTNSISEDCLDYTVLHSVDFVSEEQGRENTMLELTVTTGMELQIGDDVKIIFKGSNAPGRMRIGVDAPKEKRIERIASLVKQQEPKIVIVNKCGK